MTKHEIDYTGGSKSGYGWECSCGADGGQTWREAAPRTESAHAHLAEVVAGSGARQVTVATEPRPSAMYSPAKVEERTDAQAPHLGLTEPELQGAGGDPAESVLGWNGDQKHRWSEPGNV